jgi:hypothetical protein
MNARGQFGLHVATTRTNGFEGTPEARFQQTPTRLPKLLTRVILKQANLDPV